MVGLVSRRRGPGWSRMRYLEFLLDFGHAHGCNGGGMFFSIHACNREGNEDCHATWLEDCHCDVVEREWEWERKERREEI